MTTWYEISEVYNGEPIAYFSLKKYIKDFENFHNKNHYEINKREKPSHLEYTVSKEGEKNPIASFKTKNLAILFNIKYCNGKGTEGTNPQ
jgi:hypothetical protein